MLIYQLTSVTDRHMSREQDDQVNDQLLTQPSTLHRKCEATSSLQTSAMTVKL